MRSGYKGIRSLGTFTHLMTRVFQFSFFCQDICDADITFRSRRIDLANERLPSYTSPQSSKGPALSMRRAETFDMDRLIRKTLEEDEQGGVVERLADRIASGKG